MTLSILVAKIISIIYISGGIAVLVGSVDFNAVVGDLKKSPAVTFIAGSVGIAVGIVLVHYHNLWVPEWTVLITLIGWGFLIGGVAVVLFPKVLTCYTIKNSRFLGLFMTLFGLLMGYFGFIVK